MCENWLLNLKDYEHEKRRAALVIFCGSGAGRKDLKSEVAIEIVFNIPIDRTYLHLDIKS